jgi:hypothetical protein
MRCPAVVTAAIMIWSVALSPGALACPAAGSSRIIFYDDIPERADVAFIAKVTIIGLRYNPAKPYLWRWRYSFEGYAGVVDVIKGSVDKPVLKIAMEGWSCEGPLTVGSTGIVMGTLRSNRDGSITLDPISESLDERLARRHFFDR